MNDMKHNVNEGNWHHRVCGENQIADDQYTTIGVGVLISSKAYVCVNANSLAIKDGVHLNIADAETFAACLQVAIGKAKIAQKFISGDQI